MSGVSDKKILQKNLHQFLVQDVFNTVSEDELLRIVRSGRSGTPDKWYHKEEELQPVKIELLKKSAAAFQDDILWKILKEELRYWAHKKGNLQAVDVDDIIASKVMQYLVDVIDSKLNQMRQ